MNIICTCNAVYIIYQSTLSFINSALLSKDGAFCDVAINPFTIPYNSC